MNPQHAPKPPTHLYVGLRNRVIAEVSAPDFYPGKYLVMPIGSTDGYHPDGCDTIKEAKADVAWWRKQFPDIKVVWLS